jgi:hypothetical protein
MGLACQTLIPVLPGSLGADVRIIGKALFILALLVAAFFVFSFLIDCDFSSSDESEDASSVRNAQTSGEDSQNSTDPLSSFVAGGMFGSGGQFGVSGALICQNYDAVLAVLNLFQRARSEKVTRGGRPRLPR